MTKPSTSSDDVPGRLGAPAPVPRAAADQPAHVPASRTLEPGADVIGANGARAHGGLGSGDAAQRWLRDHGDSLWRYCLARARCVHAAADIVQETLLAAMKSHDRFAGASSERTWLLGIASHKLADHFRRAARVTSAPQAGPPGHESLFTPGGMWARCPSGPDPRAKADQDADIAALRRCMEGLAARHADAIWFRDILGVPTDETCKALGMTSTNLWTILHRARAALRMCIEHARAGTKETDS